MHYRDFVGEFTIPSRIDFYVAAVRALMRPFIGWNYALANLVAIQSTCVFCRTRRTARRYSRR